METIDLLLERDDELFHNPSWFHEPSCPVCGGPLIPLRDFYRCSRCCHSFCESCEGGIGESE